MRNQKPVLLVEDDTIDALTVKRAFHDLQMTCPLVHRVNGEEALDFLMRAGHEIPCVILLDLNMPKMNGIELLRIIKLDASLKRIPVVVLTTSNDHRDIVETFKLSVAGYVIKPVDYAQFVAAMRTIDMYWTLSEMPDDGCQTAGACTPTVACRE
jgi:CheY-like chemotaxis protein